MHQNWRRLTLNNFKEMLIEDNEMIFDLEELAEIHSINGRKMRVIIDEKELLEREKKEGVQEREGIYKRKILLYVIAMEFGPLPAANSILDFDGRLYRVIKAMNEDGIYAITLEVYVSK